MIYLFLAGAIALGQHIKPLALADKATSCPRFSGSLVRYWFLASFIYKPKEFRWVALI